MANDGFTEVTSQGWGSRIGGSLKGIFIGIVVIVGALILLFLNEGRAVKRARSLTEGGGAVVSVDTGIINAGNDGKLIHVSGMTTVDETLLDPVFGVSATALRLRRTAQMYQWAESSKSETRKKLGGGTETVTTYEYKKVWSEDLIDSSGFKDQDGHRNPSTMPFETTEWTASQAKLGSFDLPPSLINRLTDFTALPVTAEDAAKAELTTPIVADAGRFYIGGNPARPRISDVKVSFSVVLPSQISVVAKQSGGSFAPYVTRAGGSIELLQPGVVSAESMFQSAQSSNTMLTWLLRGVGFLLMFVGLRMVLAPLAVLADVVPIAGSIVGAGIGIVAFLFAFAISMVVIAVAWIIYRPLLGIALFGLALVAVVLIVRKLLKGKQAAVA